MDSAISRNREKLESNKSVKRPGLITMEYPTFNSSIKMMSPYGGTIYAILKDYTSFDITIEGAIEMPYFIQGMKFNFSEWC